MDIATLLKAGQGVKLKSNDTAEPYSIRMCLSNKLVICKADKHPIPLTSEIEQVSIIRPANNGIFIIDSNIKESSEKGIIIALNKFSEPRYIERRTRYRLDHKNIKVPLDIEVRPQNNCNRYKRVKLCDISAGGIGLVIKASSALTEGMHLNISINVETVGSISAVGEIMHVTSLNPHAKDQMIGVKFTQIDQVSQQRLMAFIQEQTIIIDNGESKSDIVLVDTI